MRTPAGKSLKQTDSESVVGPEEQTLAGDLVEVAGAIVRGRDLDLSVAGAIELNRELARRLPANVFISVMRAQSSTVPGVEPVTMAKPSRPARDSLSATATSPTR